MWKIYVRDKIHMWVKSRNIQLNKIKSRQRIQLQMKMRCNNRCKKWSVAQADRVSTEELCTLHWVVFSLYGLAYPDRNLLWVPVLDRRLSICRQRPLHPTPRPLSRKYTFFIQQQSCGMEYLSHIFIQKREGDEFVKHDLLWPSQLSFEGGLSNVLLFTNIGLVGIKVSTLSFLFADSERSILRPGKIKEID